MYEMVNQIKELSEKIQLLYGFISNLLSINFELSEHLRILYSFQNEMISRMRVNVSRKGKEINLNTGEYDYNVLKILNPRDDSIIIADSNMYKEDIFKIIRSLYSYYDDFNRKITIDKSFSFEIIRNNENSITKHDKIIQSPFQSQSSSSCIKLQFNQFQSESPMQSYEKKQNNNSKSRQKEKGKYKKEDFPQFKFINKLDLNKKVDSQLIEKIVYFFSECKILLSDKEYSNVIEYILNESGNEMISHIKDEIEGYTYLYNKFCSIIG